MPVLARASARYRGLFYEFVKAQPTQTPSVRTVNTWTPYCTSANPKLSGPPKDRKPKHEPIEIAPGVTE